MGWRESFRYGPICLLALGTALFAIGAHDAGKNTITDFKFGEDRLAIGDVIDLADISAGASATIGYTGNNSPGMLTVSDGTHTATIALLGNFSLANFIASSDGHGGTSVVDPPLHVQPVLDACERQAAPMSGDVP